MKKRILSLLIALVMAVGLLPTVAFAEDSAYDMLKAAFDAAPTDGTETVITLTGDIASMTTGQIITVQPGQNIVLDMAGYSITVASDFQGRPIVNEGTLKVTGNGTIDSSNSSDGGYGAINNKGTLTIESGHFAGAKYGDGSCIRNTGSAAVLTVYGGLFDGALCMIYNEGTATLYGGKYVSLSCSTCAAADGHRGSWSYALRNVTANSKMYAYDGVEVIGTQGAISAAIGYLEVNGGSYKTVDCDRHHGAIFYALYAAGEYGEVQCVINGGTFETEGNNTAVLIGNDNRNGDGGINADAISHVYGGTFIAPENVPALKVSQETARASIVHGGNYSKFTATEYLDENLTYEAYNPDSAAPYSYHSNLGDALNAAGNGGNIQQITNPDDAEVTVTMKNEDTTTAVEVPENSTIKLPALSRDGYTFVGWKDDNGTTYNAGDNYTVQGNVTLEAVWEETPDKPLIPGFIPGIIAGGAGSMMQHFVDVTSMDYYFDAVQWAVEHGITEGTGKVTFSPDAPCTRAQAVTFLWRAMGSRRADKAANFTDVKAGAYYADAVNWAVEKGITNGTSDTTFSPDAICTRSQIVTFLYRAIGVRSTVDAGFSDVAANAYYAEAINWAAQYGITGGTGANKFSPDAPCTRAQIVTFLYRAN